MEQKINRKKDSVEIELVFDGKEWESEVNAAYAVTAGRFSVQGFRKGKAPKGVIEKTYGEGVFTEEALKSAFTREYNKILEKSPDIKPIDYPRVKEFKAIKDGGMRIIAEVDIEPSFTLGKYNGFEVKRTLTEITDKDVTDFLKQTAESRARQVAAAKDHKIENGNIAVIDFVGSVDGVAFDGGAGTGYHLEIGSRSFIDTFEEQLIGHTESETVTVNVKFPENYPAGNLAGKDAKFTVTIKSVLVKQVPELDDRFAKESSEFDSLDGWKNSVRENLVRNAEIRSQREAEGELFKKIVDDTKVDAPDKMVEVQLDGIMNDIEQRLMMQGANLEVYAQYIGTTVDDLRESQRENAVMSVKTRLVFEAIAEKENITVTADQVQAEIKAIADANKKKISDVTKDRAQVHIIEHNLRFGKIMTFLLENNKII